MSTCLGKNAFLLSVVLLLGLLLFIGAGVRAQSVRSNLPAAIPLLHSRVVIVHIPNAIDSLRTNAQVVQWIRRHAVRRQREYFYPDFQLDTLLINYGLECQQYCAGQNMKPWVKIDLDGNGRTDLVAFRLREFFGQFQREPYIFYDYGPNGSIGIEHLQGRMSGGCEVVATTWLQGRPALLYAHQVEGPLLKNLTREVILQRDTLVHQYGSLVEYNPHPNTPRFQRLELKFGEECCTTFTMTVDADRKLKYEVQYTGGDRYYLFNLERGTFLGELDSIRFEQLQSLFQRLRPEQLARYYSVNWTDDGTVRLSASYGDHQTLEIKDYGWRANWTLMRLYELVHELRTSQRWYSVERPYDVPVR